MTCSNHEEILCYTQLSALQIIAILVPSRSYIIFAALNFAIWYNLLPIVTILGYVLVGALALAVLKLVLVVGLAKACRWRVSIDGARVEFHQGSSLVSVVVLRPEEPQEISVIDARWFPRLLRISSTDGTVLETLYGVSREDLDKVAQRLRRQLGNP